MIRQKLRLAGAGLGTTFLKNHAFQKWAGVLRSDCSPEGRLRNRPEPHAHAEALQEANPLGLTGQPDSGNVPCGAQEEAGRGEGW